MGNVTEVVAALIRKEEDGKSKFMICQRPAHKARGLLWEFVGGKTEAGETPEQALVRECREELAITVKPNRVFTDVTHIYPDLTVHLTLFEAEISAGEPTLLEHCDLRWITPEEIPQYDFCPADVEILEKIRYSFAVEQIPCGIWRHFKGNRYEVIGIAKHSENLEPMVVYRALYGEGLIWVRPASMWLQTVERNGRIEPRFVYLGETE